MKERFLHSIRHCLLPGSLLKNTDPRGERGLGKEENEEESEGVEVEEEEDREAEEVNDGDD